MDDYSRAMRVFLLKDKSETFKCVVNTQLGVLIQRVRSENGSGFTNEPLQKFFAIKEIIHAKSHSTTKWSRKA